MFAYFVRRSFSMLLTLLATSALVFVVLDWLPGNAAQVLMGADADPQAVAALAEQLGLQHSAWQRYSQWLLGLAQGDWGESYAYSQPVLPLLLERLALTLPLALLAMAVSAVLALVVGMAAAAWHPRPAATGLMAVAQLGMAVPSFWLAMLLIMWFAIHLQWLPAGGFPGWSAAEGGGLWPGLQALILPTLALAAVQAAVLARLSRSAILEVLQEDFVRTARAKGLGASAILWGHVLRNAMLPVLTLMGLQFAQLLAGAIVVENVFYLPGLGRLLFQAIANRDLVLVRNGVLLLAALVVLVNFCIDLLYAWIDPRIAQRHPH